MSGVIWREQHLFIGQMERHHNYLIGSTLMSQSFDCQLAARGVHATSERELCRPTIGSGGLLRLRNLSRAASM